MKLQYNGNRPILIKLDNEIVGKGFKVYINRNLSKGEHTLFVEELTIFDSNISFLNIFNPILFLYQFKLDGAPLIDKENYNSKSVKFEKSNNNENNFIIIYFESKTCLHVDRQKNDLSFLCAGEVRIVSEIENQISNNKIKRQKYIYILNTVFYMLVVSAFLLFDFFNNCGERTTDTVEWFIVFLAFVLFGVANIFKIRKL